MLQPPANSQQEPVSFFAALFDQNFPGKGAGTAYTNYANAQFARDPTISPYLAAKAFALIIATKGLAAGLAAGATATGTAAGQAAKSGFGSTALTSLNPLAGLFQPNLWLRVGEVMLGLILIAIGVAQLTHAVPIATKIAGAVK